MKTPTGRILGRKAVVVDDIRGGRSPVEHPVDGGSCVRRGWPISRGASVIGLLGSEGMGRIEVHPQGK